MTTSMKINKDKYLARCREALDKYTAPKKQYEADLEKWKAESKAWGEKVIKSGQLEMQSNPSGDQYFYAKGKLTSERPHKPVEQKYVPEGIFYWQIDEAVRTLKEVIALMEMTDSDTIGVSLANKAGKWL